MQIGSQQNHSTLSNGDIANDLNQPINQREICMASLYDTCKSANSGQW